MSFKDSKEVRQIKRQAKNLREYLASQGVEVPHTMALEAVSRVLGDKFWNVTHAKASGIAVPAANAEAPADNTVPNLFELRYDQIRVTLEADWNFSGQFEVGVRHPLLGYLLSQVAVWWHADLVLDEWRQGLLDKVMEGVRPLVDETLIATPAEREAAAFEVLGICCMQAGAAEADVRQYVAGVIAEWRSRGPAPLQVRSWDVEVCRTGYGHATVRVRAASQAEAETLAMDQAGDIEFSENDADYEVTGTVPA